MATSMVVFRKYEFIHISMTILNFVYILDYVQCIPDIIPPLRSRWEALKSGGFFDSLVGGKQGC